MKIARYIFKREKKKLFLFFIKKNLFLKGVITKETKTNFSFLKFIKKGGNE